ncbi:MAG: hypothetical protein PHO83_10395 [Geobacteraceae bacterium]|nr:hypothetical protein [Geobacteraceae bacterium]
MKIAKLAAFLVASAFLYACGGDGDSYTPIVTTGKTITANGGSATSGTGGDGGGVYIDVSGDVKVTKTGTVNTSFSIPTYDYHFGANPAIVTSDTTVLLDSIPATAGVLYMITDNPYLFISNGSGGGTAASGLQVTKGVTLTLPANWSIGTLTYLDFDQSVEINGTVTVEDEGDNLEIDSDSLFMIGTTGIVTTTPATAGTNAGYIDLYSYGTFINKGTINASGATGGGSAGSVDLYGDSLLYNTGSILTKGTDSTTGAGGSGNDIYLECYYSSIYSSGTLDASGGNGTSGGSGGYIHFEAGYDGYMGHLLAGGTFTSNGGSATAADAYGGGGGDIYLDNYGGKLWANASVSTKGGDSAAGYGGDGGYYQLYNDDGEDYEYGNDAEAEGVRLTGNIDLSGGDGALGGGDGDEVEIYNDYSDTGLPPMPAVELVGYSKFTMNGGTGSDYGGDGGWYDIYTYDWWIGDDYTVLPVGYIINDVPAEMKGGDADLATGDGGDGGEVDFETENDYAHLAMTLTNRGNMDLTGGAGYYGGDSGWVYMYGYDGLTNSGTMTVMGGEGVVEGGDGPDYLEFYSTYDVVNSGAIKGGGGIGDTGGYGGYVYMYAGGQVKNTAAITLLGGTGDVTGGEGGYIDLWSQQDATANSGKLSVTGGDGGTTDGIDGWIYIDSVDVGPVH